MSSNRVGTLVCCTSKIELPRDLFHRIQVSMLAKANQFSGRVSRARVGPNRVGPNLHVSLAACELSRHHLPFNQPFRTNLPSLQPRPGRLGSTALAVGMLRSERFICDQQLTLQK